MARGFEAEDYPEADRAEGCLHPRSVYDLIGHSGAEAKYLQAVEADRLHHAWLLTGASGIGKATLAYRMARHRLGGQTLLEGSLNIPASDPVAQRIEALGHGNFTLLRRPYQHDKKKLASIIPVDQVRAMSDFFQTTASENGEWRVCIIDSVDELNRNAENAILKLLEEPPARTLFILISSAPGRLLPTIRSRCLQVALRPVPEAEIMNWLGDRSSANHIMQQAAIRLSHGAPGKALSLLSHIDDVLRPLEQFMNAVSGRGGVSELGLAKALSGRGTEQSRALFWNALEDVLQAQAIFGVTGDWSGPFQPIESRHTPEQWDALWSQVQDARRAETAINLDKTSNLFTTLSQIRSAA